MRTVRHPRTTCVPYQHVHCLLIRKTQCTTGLLPPNLGSSLLHAPILWGCSLFEACFWYPTLRSQGHAVTQLVEALRYKPEGRGFDSRWCHWNFSLTSSFRPRYGPGINSVSNRNEYQEYFLEGKGGRCVGLTTLPPLCADCLEIWDPQTPGTLRACPGLLWDCFTFLLRRSQLAQIFCGTCSNSLQLIYGTFLFSMTYTVPKKIASDPPLFKRVSLTSSNHFLCVWITHYYQRRLTFRRW